MADHYPLPVIFIAADWGDIWSECWSNCFFYLYEQWIIVTIAKKQREVRSGSDGSNTHDPVRDIGDPISSQHEASLRR